MTEEQRYQQGSVIFESGDTLLLYTDGLSEAQSPDEQEFGVGRLVDALRESQGRSARDRVDFLRRKVKLFTRGSPQADDLTIMLVNRL